MAGKNLYIICEALSLTQMKILMLLVPGDPNWQMFTYGMLLMAQICGDQDLIAT